MKSRVAELKAQGKPLTEILQVAVPEFQQKYQHWDNPEWVKNAVEHLDTEL